ncbi:CoA-transferase [Methylomicrobium sp. Wu6]|uniref:CoA-transferase n=1 Tax=Methylomicrobium sp. Wu6 TaxID=3107928 RepID=UPI002DD6B829|nr:CoA-transferase [Methylomicrobium sp. Wu6]MEC4749537.1 CoA transferase [Methylomicrobium sp. Wu6]
MNEPVRTCTLGELMIYQIALTIEDGILAFHGFGSPLVQLALHLAKRSHAPNLVLVAGATYAVNPSPLFLTPTSNDFVMSVGAECDLNIEELFDLAASGRMGRMFLSGLQIDPWGNLNVTRLGDAGHLKLKLPGGGGGCNLSCDAGHITIWTAAHRAPPDQQGRRRFRLVDRCDFVTSVGHRSVDGRPRSELPYRGKGPDWIVTDLGIFDFDATGHARLNAVYPDTTVELVAENTGFDFPVAADLACARLPEPGIIELIRRLDPMRIHRRELSHDDRTREFEL